MGIATSPLDVLLVINAVAAALFIYAAYEAYHQSKPDLDGATEVGQPWVEKVILGGSVILLALVVAIALALAYSYHYGA